MDSSPKSKDLPEFGVFNPQEQMEIVREIETLMAGNQEQDSSDLEQFRPKRRGLLFIFSINIALAALAGGALWVGQWYFTSRIEAQRELSSQRFSAEGQLVAKLLEKSRQELEAKNREIADIQEQMKRLGDEKASLAANFDRQLQSRELELKSQLEQELAAERAKLQAQGVSEAEITRRMQELEKSRTEEYNRALTRLREESQAQLAARTKELEDLQTRLDTAKKAEEEVRKSLADAARDRETALKTQLGDQAAALENLTKDREAQNQFNTQLAAGVGDLQRQMSLLNFDGAAESLLDLQGWLRKTRDEGSPVLKVQAESALGFTASIQRALGEIRTRTLAAGDPRYEEFKRLSSEALGLQGPARAEALQKAFSAAPELQGAYKAAEDLMGERASEVYAQALDEARAPLVKQQQQTLEELEAIKTLRTSLEAEKNRLLQENQALSAQSAQNKAALESLTLENQTLVKDLEIAKNAAADPVEVQALKEEVGRLTEINQTLTQEVADLNTRLAGTSETDARVDNLTAELEDGKRRQAELQTQLDTAQKDLDQARQDLVTAQTAGTTLDPEALIQLQEEVDRLRAREASLSEENLQLQASLEETRGAFQGTETLLAEANARLEASEAALAESQKALEALKTLQDQDLTEEGRALADLQAQVESLTTARDELQTKVDTLEASLAAAALRESQLTAFTQTYLSAIPPLLSLQNNPSKSQVDAARRTLTTVFETPEGQSLFPDFAQVIKSLYDAQEALIPPPVRTQALEDVLSVTRYLSGGSASAVSDQQSVERLSRQDERFKKIVDSIQELSRKGAAESILRTENYTLFGPLVFLSSGKGVVEALTSARAEAGLKIQIKAPGRGGELKASGTVSLVNGRRVEVDVTQVADPEKPPRSGDVVYLEVR